MSVLAKILCNEPHTKCFYFCGFCLSFMLLMDSLSQHQLIAYTDVDFLSLNLYYSKRAPDVWTHQSVN